MYLLHNNLLFIDSWTDKSHVFDLLYIFDLTALSLLQTC